MSTEIAQKPGCLGFVADQIRRILGLSPKAPPALPYRRRDDFLSPAELSYYKVLTSVLGPRAVVLAKVRLADILYVPRSGESMRYFNRIAQRHVDFLLCESSDMRPVLVIELDDASHDRPTRRGQDAFLDEALRVAEVPILRVKPRREYSREDVIAQLEPLLTQRPKATASVAFGSEPAQSLAEPRATSGSPPICPKCGVPMVVRTATQGKHKGRKFYGCPNYPRCKEVLPLPAIGAAG